MTNEPLISVIIPAYSGTHLLDRAIRSALAQDMPLEIIVINDCSPEDVDGVMAAYIGEPAVVYLKNPKNLGAAETRNRAISHAMGKYIAIQNQMSDEEKATVFANLNKEIFFEEVYSDYLNTFLSLIHILSENGVLGNVSNTTNEQYDIMINNLKNPMFPQDKVAPLLAQLVEQYPFSQTNYDVMKEKYGDTDEIKQIAEYFSL